MLEKVQLGNKMFYIVLPIFFDQDVSATTEKSQDVASISSMGICHQHHQPHLMKLKIFAPTSVVVTFEHLAPWPVNINPPEKPCRLPRSQRHLRHPSKARSCGGTDLGIDLVAKPQWHGFIRIFSIQCGLML